MDKWANGQVVRHFPARVATRTATFAVLSNCTQRIGPVHGHPLVRDVRDQEQTRDNHLPGRDAPQPPGGDAERESVACVDYPGRCTN